jgi:hypothetical protein
MAATVVLFPLPLFLVPQLKQVLRLLETETGLPLARETILCHSTRVSNRRSILLMS